MSKNVICNCGEVMRDLGWYETMMDLLARVYLCDACKRELLIYYEEYDDDIHVCAISDTE